MSENDSDRAANEVAAAYRDYLDDVDAVVDAITPEQIRSKVAEAIERGNATRDAE